MCSVGHTLVSEAGTNAILQAPKAIQSLTCFHVEEGPLKVGIVWGVEDIRCAAVFRGVCQNVKADRLFSPITDTRSYVSLEVPAALSFNVDIYLPYLGISDEERRDTINISLSDLRHAYVVY